MNTKELTNTLEQHLNIPETHRVIAVYENDESDEAIGYIVAEKGKEGYFPVLTPKELIETYGKK